MYDFGIDRGPPRRIEAIALARIAALQSTLGWVAPMATRPALVQALEGGGAVAFDHKQQKPKAAAKSKRLAMLSGEQFFDARMLACRALVAEHGANWHLVEGASYWGTIPPKMRRFVTARGSVCKAKPDARLPAAKYWPGGELPAGIVLSPDMPRDRTPRAVVLANALARQIARAEASYRRALLGMRRSRERARRGSSWGMRADNPAAEHRENIQEAWNLRRDLRALLEGRA